MSTSISTTWRANKEPQKIKINREREREKDEQSNYSNLFQPDVPPLMGIGK
jgi:hypothetical protein